MSGLFASGFGEAGPGIFIAAAIVAAYTLGFTPIAFALAGLILAVTALTLAEGAAMFPDSGGSAALTRHAFNDFVSYLAGWALLLDCVVTLAISAFSAAQFAGWFFEPLRDGKVCAVGAMGLVAVLVPIHALGVRGPDRFGQAILALWLLAMAVMAIAGWTTLLAVGLLLFAANAALLGGVRLAYSMGAQRQLPQEVSRLHPRFKTAQNALVLFGGLAIVLLASAFLWADLLGNLANLYGFGALLAFILAHAAILTLRANRPDLDRSFRVPLNFLFRGKEFPLPAVLGLLATAALWLAVVLTHAWGLTIGLFWLLGGFILFAVHRQHEEEFSLVARGTAGGAELLIVPKDLKRILVPTLGTAFSEEMVAVACRLAKREQATVRALYIYEVPPSLPVTELPPDEQRKGATILERAAQIGEGLGVKVELALYQGRKAGPMIVTEAERLGVDVILMGLDPGRRLRVRVGGAPTTGKTVEYVLKHCRCRVLLSRPWRDGSDGPDSAGVPSIESLVVHSQGPPR